jgi:hypothetical protein
VRDSGNYLGEKMLSFKSSKLLPSLLATFISSSVFVAPVANAAYTVTPKVGQCFQYTKAQVSASYASKNPISCSSSHNMETFAVVKWPLKSNPADMNKDEVLDLVFQRCDFLGRFPNAPTSKFSSTSINYWAWYTPSPAAWAKGQRWLRCDAMIGKFESEEQWPPASHISWKGLKLNG